MNNTSFFMSYSKTHYSMYFWHDEHIRVAISSCMKTPSRAKANYHYRKIHFVIPNST